MEFLIEGLLDLIVEGSMEASQNKKVPKGIRYLLIAFVVLIFATIILGLFTLEILIFNKNKLGGIFTLLVSIFLFVGTIIKFRNVYLKKKAE